MLIDINLCVLYIKRLQSTIYRVVLSRQRLVTISKIIVREGHIKRIIFAPHSRDW